MLDASTDTQDKHKKLADSIFSDCEKVDDSTIDLIMKLPYDVRTSIVDLLEKQARMMSASQFTDQSHGSGHYQSARLTEARASLSYRQEYEKLLNMLIPVLNK